MDNQNDMMKDGFYCPSCGKKNKLAANNNARYITELTYAGGNYTDTLVYEVDYEDIVFPDGGVPITSFMFFGGEGYVNDFAYKTAREPGKAPHYENNSNPFGLYSTTSLKIEADLRVPTVELKAENKTFTGLVHDAILKYLYGKNEKNI